jgi:hypothetical protein
VARWFGVPFCRFPDPTSGWATVTKRCFEYYANSIESFCGDTVTVLEDKFGSWRQPESWT